MNPYIYTPPEIIAREVKREFKTPAKGCGVAEKKSNQIRFAFIWLGVITCPIWAILMLLLLCKTWFVGA